MTRSGVGRSQRTASRLAYAPPTGEGPLGLPAIQGVAERVTVRFDRAAVRLGLRTLVVAGFAGAAWLLCANAAQAADAPATDRTSDPSAVDLIAAALGGGGADEDPASERAASAALVSPVADALATAHQPVLGTASELLADAQAAGSTATSVVLPSATAAHATPIAEPALPAGAAGAGPARSDGDHAGGNLLPGSVGGLTQALDAVGRAVGLTEPLNPVARTTTPVTAPLDGLLRPVTGSLHSIASPVTTAMRDRSGDAAPRPVPDVLGRAGGATGAGSATSSVERDAPAASPAAQVVTAAPANDRAATVTATRVDVTRTDDRSAFRTRAGAEHAAAGHPALSAGTPAVRTGTNDVPDRPAPAPMRGWVGLGPSTSGSSAVSEGGAFAAAPASIAASPAADSRLTAPADVDVPRRDAEAPTVSPD
jgi:hypothetical protein